MDEMVGNQAGEVRVKALQAQAKWFGTLFYLVFINYFLNVYLFIYYLF